MKKLSAYLLITSLIALVGVTTYSSGQPPKKDVPKSFKQYLGVYTKSFPKQQIVLKDAKIKQLGDRSFLVGTPIAVEDNSTKLTAKRLQVWWIALSEITEFYEFENVQGYRFDGNPPRYSGQ